MGAPQGGAASLEARRLSSMAKPVGPYGASPGLHFADSLIFQLALSSGRTLRCLAAHHSVPPWLQIGIGRE